MPINKKDYFEENSDQIGEKGNSIKKTERKLTRKEILAKKKEAYECRLPMGGLASETIQRFVDYVEKGENCYCVLNGKKVYSIDLQKTSQEHGCDLENAFYLIFYGRTKIEQWKRREEYDKQRELDKKRKELEAIEKIPGWIEEGQKHVDESKWSDWKGFVEYAARGTYHGEEVQLVLKILGMIDSGDSRQKIQKVLDDEGGEGYYYSIVRNRVIYYSRKGIAARDNLHEPY